MAMALGVGNSRIGMGAAALRPARPPISRVGRRTSGGDGVCAAAAAAAASQRVSFSSSVYTDLQLREFKAVPFEQYMDEEDRVFNALFPDRRRRQRLNEEEWRIFMLPLEFFFLSVRPVVDMRVTMAEPPESIGRARAVSKMLTLEATRWELRGLDYVVDPSEFDLGIMGSLYPERGARGPRLKGQMKLTVDLAIPPSLALMPPAVIENVGSALMSQLLGNMKETVNTKLLEDYQAYALQQQRAGQVSA